MHDHQKNLKWGDFHPDLGKVLKTGYFHENIEKGLFLLFFAGKSVHRKLYKAFSLFSTYIYTGEEFLRERGSELMILG